ncbi:hypothetical protein EAX61_12625 [Dokdonia sinensis]|uniref:Uncharacterized protein n=1 Tax=Dokdonia sinensis TaxID=2479847 RepID=A0A3M0FWL9_9FLAO|nr:hypothetical protein [Dokdonia sinensis]RMB56905.1 hypothetical protein EAX61_12625 [Dokdonia sinensis]
MTYVNEPKWNIISLLFVVAASTMLVVNGDFSNGRGMALLVIAWIPLIVGVITLAIYGISRLLFKKYNWIITLLGILFLLNASIQFYLK